VEGSGGQWFFITNNMVFQEGKTQKVPEEIM